MKRAKKSPPTRRSSLKSSKPSAVPKSASKKHGLKWLSSAIPKEGPVQLVQALESLSTPASIAKLIAALAENLISDELRDPQKAPGHFAKLVEMMVWRFELLVRSGQLDEVLPRLTALPLLYSPTMGPGASKWDLAHEIFKSKRVGQDSVVAHHAFEPNVARRVDYGQCAFLVVTLLRLAKHELSACEELRSRAQFNWVEEMRRDRKSKTIPVHWYHCGDCILRWPIWFEDCRHLPERRTAAPSLYRKAAQGMLSEFFAVPENEYAEAIRRTKFSKFGVSGSGGGS